MISFKISTTPTHVESKNTTPTLHIDSALESNAINVPARVKMMPSVEEVPINSETYIRQNRIKNSTIVTFNQQRPVSSSPIADS